MPNFSGGVLAQLHANEMVLPANISQGLQAALTGGGFSGGGPVMNFTINAMDGQSVHRVLMANAPSIVQAFNRGARNGVFPRVS